jgi:hypothetical protein
MKRISANLIMLAVLCVTVPRQAAAQSLLGYDPGKQESSEEAVETGGPFISTRSFFVSNNLFNLEATAEFPVLGRLNPGEHNSPLPRDRVYAIYKRYDNALSTRVCDHAYPFQQNNRAIDQYLLGFEKTFHCERSSLELRMPLLNTGNSQFACFGSDDASIGNLGIIGKRLIHGNRCNPISIGCALTVPTGDDTTFSIVDQQFRFRNESVHLMPFLAMMRQTASRRSYLISFATVDLPLGGNGVEFTAPAMGTQNLGGLDDQSLLYLDVALGHWLHRDLSNPFLIGLALQAELHYAGSLESADSLSGVIPGAGWNTQFAFGNSRGQFDNALAAIMLYCELRNNVDLRVSGLFPMTGEDDRFFDSELIVALQRRF